ncbi:hypothetical protein ABB02_01999 [Clostridiaceae bacterium JG1575]|nr:hypothetical protein ABB02_01999 [Clostridiaceae bacterium JG1575]
MNIKDHLAQIRAKLAPGVTLLAVSKTKPVSDVLEAYEAGQRAFGENRVGEWREKAKELPSDIQWHFIGTLQRNKVKYLDSRIALIHSVDRVSLAKEIQRRAHKKGYVQDVLLEVNIGGEAQKGGIAPKELPELLAFCQTLPNLRLRGLMTIIPNTQDEGEQRQYFEAMKGLFDTMKAAGGSAFDTLSMGMSGDYEIAMVCGSTLVRVGSAIFGARPPQEKHGSL